MGVKFRLDYCDANENEARLDIEVKGYGGAIHSISAGANPFVLHYKNENKDKSGYFVTSSADIEIYEDDNFTIDSLLTSDETAIKVTHYINQAVHWVGFVVPDFYETSIESPRLIRLSASDRLVTLKEATLEPDSGLATFKELVQDSLAKTGLSLSLNYVIGFKPDGAASFDFLNEVQAYGQRLFDTQGRQVSCWDIVRSVLVIANAYLMQQGGEWYIINKWEHEQNAADTEIQQVEVGARRKINPPASSVGVMAEYGGGQTYPKNFDFSSITGWTAHNGFNAQIKSKRLFGISPIDGAAIFTEDDDRPFLLNRNDRPTTLAGAAYLESSDIPVISNNTKKAVVKITIAARSSQNTALFSITAHKGATVKAWQEDGSWGGVPASVDDLLTLNIGTSFGFPVSAQKEYEVVLGEPLFGAGDVNDWHLKVRIYGSKAGSTPPAFNDVIYDMVSAVNVNDDVQAKGNLFEIKQGVNFTKAQEIDTTVWGDYVTQGINGYFYAYPDDDLSILHVNDTPAELWVAPGDANAETLLLHSVRQRARMFSKAHNIITATIEGLFNPLDLYEMCGDKYVLVSATFDFLRTKTSLVIEQVGVDGGVVKRDYIYSYFGDNEVKSIKGIGAVSSGSTASNGVTDHGQLTGLNRPADHPWALKTDFSNITDIDDLKSLLDNEYLIKSLNLSDVDSIPTARSNLSIYSKSESDNRYLRRSNNLNDLQNVQTARNNLDVWSKAEADNLYLSRLNHTDILYDKLIGINDYLTADSQNRKLYAWELEINNLAQPVGTEHTEYFKTLRDGYSPLDYTAHDVSYEATSGGYALFSSINAWLETEMIDLSGKTAVKISFDVAKYGTGADGPLHVQYSINDGATWLNLGLSEIPTDSTYKKTTLSVPYVSDEMRFRFLRHYSNSAKRLRDIEIKAKDTIGIGERYIITTDGADLIIKEDVNELLRLSDLGDLSVKNIKVTNAIEPGGIYYANAQGYAENSEYATLNPNGEMTVKSLHVTQRMTVNELEVIKMRYSFGSHVFGVGGGIVNKVTDDGNGYFYLEFTEPHGMTNDDYLMLQVFDPTSHNTLRYAELEVISVVDLKEIYVRKKSGGDDPIEGDHVVVVASTDSNRDSFIYINPYGPHIDLYDEVEKIDDFILGIPKVRIGELSGLPQIGDITPSGYSLFAEKAFLKDAIISGAIYLTNDQTSNIAGEVILDIDGAITNEDGDFILNKDGLMLSPSSDYNVPGSMIMFGDENELYGFIRADFNENQMIISTPMNKDILIAPGDFNKPNFMGNLIIRTAGFVPPNNHFGIILENLTNTDPSVYAPVGTLWRDGSGYVRIV